MPSSATFLSQFTNEHGLAFVKIKNQLSETVICLQGAHICSFIPLGEQDLLFVSKAEDYLPGKAIRGGIPICWPWFGDHPTDSSKAAHGFVRTVNWHVSKSKQLGDATQVTLSLTNNDIENDSFEFPFRLELVVTVSSTLSIELITHNLGQSAIEISEALHTYIATQNISDVVITGLNQQTFINKVNNSTAIQVEETLTIVSETDAVYIDFSGDVTLADKQRTLSLKREGSQSLVVWNPWQEKAKALSNFNDDEFQNMICIETANALSNSVTVKPLQQHSLTMDLSVLNNE